MRQGIWRTACLCFALALSACGGGGGGNTEDPIADGPSPTPPPASPTPTPPPDPAPTPPPTPPAPSPPSPAAPPPPSPTPPTNRAPVADAGDDQETVEEQDVTIDGSATRDPDGDALSYQWTLVSAPIGSHIAVSASSPSFAFRPDIPGEYRLQLTVSDASMSRSDTMRVTAEPLFNIAAGEKFVIDGASREGSDRLSLKLKTSGRYRGGPVTFSANSNAPWLTAPASGTFGGAGAEAVVTLQLKLDELQRMTNGTHEAIVTISPNGGWAGATSAIVLDLALPLVRHVSPYVAYVGESSRVTLRGEKLLKANGQSLFIGGVEALDVVATSDSSATIDLPPLAAGTYTVRIGHALDVGREMARVVVRPPPVYADVDGRGDTGPLASSFQYDAERDAIYYVLFAPNGIFFAAKLWNDGAGAWHEEFLPLTPLNFEPRALALSPDGKELLVTSLKCWVHRIDPDTFAILESSQKPGCPEGSEFTEIAPLADGRILVVEDTLNGNSEILEYPGFAPTDVLPPRQDAFLVSNGNRDRLLYVQGHEATTDVYDIDGESESVHLQGHPAGLHPTNLSMSTDGSRTLHATNLYDRDFTLTGRLERDGSVAGSALNAQGTRAVTLDVDTNAIYVHDVTGSRPVYPQIGPEAVLPDDITSRARVFVPLSGGAVFSFGFVSEIIRGYHTFHVRVHPDLTR